MKLTKIIELIDTKNSWGKDQLKTALLMLLAEDIDLVRDDLSSKKSNVDDWGPF